MAITITNLVLATIILVLGIWAYGRTKSSAALMIGIAFGFFAVSHLLTLLGLAAGLANLLVVIRVLGYLSAIFAVWRIGAAYRAGARD